MKLRKELTTVLSPLMECRTHISNRITAGTLEEFPIESGAFTDNTKLAEGMVALDRFATVVSTIEKLKGVREAATSGDSSQALAEVDTMCQTIYDVLGGISTSFFRLVYPNQSPTHWASRPKYAYSTQHQLKGIMLSTYNIAMSAFTPYAYTFTNHPLHKISLTIVEGLLELLPIVCSMDTIAQGSSGDDSDIKGIDQWLNQIKIKPKELPTKIVEHLKPKEKYEWIMRITLNGINSRSIDTRVGAGTVVVVDQILGIVKTDVVDSVLELSNVVRI